MAFGLTIVDPLVATALPLSSTWLVLEVVHVRVLLPPLTMLVGLAVNELIIGVEQEVAVTVVCALAVMAHPLVAVRV